MLLNYGKNIFYVFRFLLVTMILFQIPIILELLLAMNMVNRRAVLKASRFVIVGIFALAAILTPPDFVSQIGVALPLIAKLFKFGEG